MTKVHKATVTKAIKRLVRAEINESWKGAGDPMNHNRLALELHEARTALDELIRKLIANQRDAT